MSGLTQATAAGATVVGTSAASLSIMFPDDPNLLVIAMAGFLGGVCRWMSNPKMSIKLGLRGVLLGTIFAIYAWPFAGSLLENWTGAFEAQPITRIAFGAFMSGLMAEIMISASMRFVELKFRKEIEQ